MPYTVIEDAEGCGGYAVVKAGERIPFDGGCHALKSDAMAQMVALNIATKDEERAEPNLKAPSFMAASARRGLRLHEEGESGAGLKPQTVADARKMANGEALSPQKWKKIAPWIARHIVDLDAVQGDEITPGLVAMLLWGGGSSKASARRAQAYAERVSERLSEERYDPSQPRDDNGKFASGGGGMAVNPADEFPDEYDQPDFDEVYFNEDDFDMNELQAEIDRETISDERAGTIAGKLSEKENNFNNDGGRVETLTTGEDFDKAAGSVSIVREQSAKEGWGKQKDATNGQNMTQTALTYRGSKGDEVIVATKSDGSIAGAVAFSTTPTSLGGERVVGGSGGALEIHNLGSMGNADGTGSVLFGRVVRRAAATNSGIKLQPLDDRAASFWAGMGFTDAPGGMMVMNAESVKKVAGRL